MKRFSKITAALTLGLVAALSFSLTAQTPSGAPAIPMPKGDVRQGAPTPGTPPKIQIGKAETFKLDNGLSVIVVENHKLPTVSFQIFVDNDPVLEKDAVGYVQMVGELLTKGTKTRSKVQIDEQVDFLGASLSSSSRGVSGSCLTKHSDKLLEIMADVLMNPVFPEEELEKAKRRQESNLASAKDDANSIAANVGSVLRYGKDHPYGEIMTEASLAKVNLDQIQGFYNTYFKPNISYFVVVGDVTKATAEKYAKQYFGAWKRGDVPKHTYAVPTAPAKTQVDFVNKPGAVQSVINITYPVNLQPGTPEAIKSRVTNALFGGYFNSRINANLREGHGWTYGARSSLSPDKLVGSFNASASVRNAVTDSSLIEFFKEMERMRNEKVPNDELQVVKNVLTGQFSQSLEQPGTIASFALSTARYNYPADYYEKYLEVLQSVTPDDVMKMAKEYITPGKAHVLVVGNKDDVAENLKPFSMSGGKVNFYDVYGNPVEDSKMTVPADMTADKVIEDYINAIGGTEKINTIKDLQITSVLKTPGPEFVVKVWQKGGKVATEMMMNGQKINSRVYDGTTAKENGMGGARDLEGEELTDMKEQAAFCKEATYKAEGYKLTLKGLEAIEGNNAYVVEVERPDGKKSTEYYDMKTSLKIRELSSVEGPDGQPATMTNDFSNYKETAGVLFPNTVTLTGIFPMPVKGEVTELKVNEGIDDSVFKL
ncbi:MAG: insulinase family protein [Saprospiraceae bacterium]|nr:insulinase family protein [Saprospiraceae bacterium]MCB0576865.1 insulinase family protein [Saprospiraceae bacterium]MCB9354690.1 insulinase family protein [Lewinellaceae bacterium]